MRISPRPRFLGLSSLLIVALLVISGCVPYQKYRDVETELGRTARVNRDLEKQMKEAELRLAQHGGREGIAEAGYRGLQQRYEALLAEKESLERANAALIDQLDNLPDIFPQDQGFNENEARDAGFEIGSRGNLILDSDLVFNPGRATIASGMQQRLDELARIILSNHNDKVIHINGHTDVTPIRKSAKRHKDNWELGMKRAHAVFAYLKSKQVPEDSMRLYSAGYAEPAEGVVNNKSEEGKAKCRRVEIWLGKPIS